MLSAAGAATGAAVLSACGRASPGASPGGAAKQAVIELEKGGAITIQLFPEVAPKTVENFEQKAGSGFYNGLIFHRVEDWVVQGGDPRGNGTGGNMTLPTELSDRPFGVGAVGVARLREPAEVSNDAQFFICTQPAEHLNRQYTNFGQVVDGMDVVRSIRRGDKIKRITLKS